MKTFATGDIAQMCDVNTRTVMRWIESGKLKAFKLPGRGNNCVKSDDFLLFLQEHDMPIPAELSSDHSDRSVLIIDDDAAVARSIAKVLRKAGYETDIASDGFQGGGLMMKLQPALVTLDLRMSGLNGYDVLKFIRNTADIAHTKVIVISALDHTSLQRALDEGADAVLAKPFDIDKLLEIVQQLISPSEQAVAIN